MIDRDLRIGVVGATGAVGRVTLDFLAERGYRRRPRFASSRSAGKQCGRPIVEEATPEALGAGDLDVCLLLRGHAAPRRELVPARRPRRRCRGRQVARPTGSARDPARRPRGQRRPRARERRDRREPELLHDPAHVRAAPLYEAAGLARVRVATYQSVSGAGAQAMERLRGETPDEHDLRMDWEFDGEEFDEESKLRAETRKIMELPDLPIQATCVRVPVMVGHAEAVWIETEEPLSAERAGSCSTPRRRCRLDDFPSPGKAAGTDEVLVGRVRRDPTTENGLALFLAATTSARAPR